jgi:hypothetical protein
MTTWRPAIVQTNAPVGGAPRDGSPALANRHAGHVRIICEAPVLPLTYPWRVPARPRAAAALLADVGVDFGGVRALGGMDLHHRRGCDTSGFGLPRP